MRILLLALSTITDDSTGHLKGLANNGSLYERSGAMGRPRNSRKRRFDMRGLEVSALLISCFVLLPNAQAAKKDATVRAAKRACLTGDPAKGVELLTDLYIESNDPIYIFNQGRCYEQNNRYKDAIGRFREYLRKAKDASQADRSDAEKHIADCRALLHEESPSEPGREGTTTAAPKSEATATAVATPALTPSSASVIPPSAAVATAPEPLAISQSAPPPEPQESPPVYKRWWFWTGVGAVVAGGVVTAILLSSKSAPKSPVCDGSGICVQQ